MAENGILLSVSLAHFLAPEGPPKAKKRPKRPKTGKLSFFFCAQDLRAADEVWVTSATKEIAPIVKFGEEKIGNGQVGPIWRQVMNMFQEYKLSEEQL